jgi:DNA-binding response OmpR family regulator
MSIMLPTLLIVEKDPATLELYRRELNRDFEVLVCSGKNEVLQTIQGQNVNAMVLEPAAWNGQG